MQSSHPDPAPPGMGDQNDVDQQRYEALQELEDWLETPVMVLGVLWLVLLIIDLTSGLSPFLNAVVLLIWIIFLLDFLLRFFLAPHKLEFLRHNWLTAISLFVPALRIGRVARLVRVFRALRGASLVSMVSSVNRGMRILRRVLQQNAFGYVVMLTVVVLLVGSAGILAYEGPVSQGYIHGYGDALWWTSMIMTTLGSDYWPRTAEGRLLTVLLSLYALAILGYLTATLATFFLGQQSGQEDTLSPEQARALREEIHALRLALQNQPARKNAVPDANEHPLDPRNSSQGAVQ